MYDENEFDLVAFVEKLKQKRFTLEACDATDDEIRRVDRLCFQVKGAVAARKNGIHYRDSLKRLYQAMRLGTLPKWLAPEESLLFGSLLEEFASRAKPPAEGRDSSQQTDQSKT